LAWRNRSRPFLGSGSALIAAEFTGRVCCGIELDPLYVDVIIRRDEAATGAVVILADSGETFEKLAARTARMTNATSVNG
jgi:DNA modification methylase